MSVTSLSAGTVCAVVDSSVCTGINFIYIAVHGSATKGAGGPSCWRGGSGPSGWHGEAVAAARRAEAWDVKGLYGLALTTILHHEPACLPFVT